MDLFIDLPERQLRKKFLIDRQVSTARPRSMATHSPSCPLPSSKMSLYSQTSAPRDHCLSNKTNKEAMDPCTLSHGPGHRRGPLLPAQTPLQGSVRRQLQAEHPLGVLCSELPASPLQDSYPTHHSPAISERAHFMKGEPPSESRWSRAARPRPRQPTDRIQNVASNRRLSLEEEQENYF